MPKPIQLARLAIANEVILCVARHGRKFFSSHGDERVQNYPERFSHFEYGDGLKPRLKFRDKYTWKLIDISQPHRWRGFSDGGTLRAIVEMLAGYIVRGKPISNHFGPWHKDLCGGDLWGYGIPAAEAMRAEMNPIIERATALVDPSHEVAAKLNGEGK